MITKKFIAGAIVVIFVVLIAFASPNDAQAGLSLKIRLYGGVGYLSGGDVNTGLQGMSSFYGNEFLSYGASGIVNFNAAHLGPVLGGDFILQISPVFGIALGTGYLQASRESDVALTVPGGVATLISKPELHAIPINLSLFASVPSGPLTINFHAGLGYYLSKPSAVFRIEGGGNYIQYDYQVDTKGGVGVQGGIGFEFRIASRVSFFVEGQGQYARIDGYDGSLIQTQTGTPTQTSPGKLYYFERPSGIGSYPWLTISSYDLTQIPIAKAHEAIMDFSGFAFVVGIAIKI